MDTQEAANLRLAAEFGYEIDPAYTWREQGSGADQGRPLLAAMKRVVAEGRVDAVFIYDTDRLARDPLEVLTFIRHCKECGVSLYFADGTSVQTAEQEAIQFLRGFLGQQQREKMNERTMRGKRATARAGRMPNGCGRGFYGYEYDKSTQTMVVNEAEALVLVQIFDWRVSGIPVDRIAKTLNVSGIPTKLGCQWEARTVRTKLLNETYTGTMLWGQKRHRRINGRRVESDQPESDWIPIDGYFPKIIEQATYERVQEMWGKPQSPERRNKRPYPFTGFMTCGECGSSMMGSTQKKKYPFYRCSGTVPTPKRDRYCYTGGIRAEPLEHVILEHLRNTIKNSDGVISELRQYWETGSGDLRQEIKRLEREIEKCARQIRILAMERAKELIDQTMFEGLIAPITNLKGSYEQDLELLAKQRALSEEGEAVERNIRACFDRYVQEIDDLDSDGVRALLNLFKVHVVATKNRVVVTGVIDPRVFTIEHTLALRRGRSCRSRPTGIRRGWMNWLPRWRFCHGPARLRCLAGTAR